MTTYREFVKVMADARKDGYSMDEMEVYVTQETRDVWVEKMDTIDTSDEPINSIDGPIVHISEDERLEVDGDRYDL